LNNESEEQLASTDRNGATVLCQLVFFEHNKSQWRGSFFHTAQVQSFIAVDVSATTNQLKSTLREALVVVIPFSVLLCVLGAWFITSNTIRPINRLQTSMNMVTKKDLSHRLPEHKTDEEFKLLIAAYNTMLERLEDSFQQISRFTADAAHELKTPLTVLRGKLEQAVINENVEQLDLNAILDEVGHLSAITRKLLLLSQADAGSMALHLEAINITDLLDELTADMELLSDELVLHCAIEQALITQGDTVLLKQLLNNLLVNVMRYSLHEKGVTIQAKQHGSQIEVLISNFCLPMSDAVRVQLFERFYRGEPEHMQGLSGSGLGLSLAREIARAHDGDLIIEASDKELFTLRLSLPIAK
jgi:signal transduction histidine kinase